MLIHVNFQMSLSSMDADPPADIVFPCRIQMKKIEQFHYFKKEKCHHFFFKKQSRSTIFLLNFFLIHEETVRLFVALTLSQTSPGFHVSTAKLSLLKTLREKEKLLVTSNFSFSHSVFYPFGELNSAIFIISKVVVCKFFPYGRV